MVFDEWMLFFDEYSGYRKIIGGCFDPFVYSSGFHLASEETISQASA